jgi:hypothetical protein
MFGLIAALVAEIVGRESRIKLGLRQIINENSGPVRFVTEATRMFATYKVVALYQNGRREQVMHGLPRDCIAEAARLNDLIGREDSEGTKT